MVPAVTNNEATAERVRALPEALAQEVSDYIDFVVMRHSSSGWEAWREFEEMVRLAEEGIRDYRTGLQCYESQLTRGEVAW